MIFSGVAGVSQILADPRRYVMVTGPDVERSNDLWGGAVRKSIRWIAGLAAVGLGVFATAYSVQLAWSEQESLTGQIRTTFFEAAMRSCVKSQIDAPGISVFVLFEYCKCYADGMADKMSNDEVKSLEAIGDEKKYAEALHTRAEATGKLCLEAVRKSHLKSN